MDTGADQLAAPATTPSPRTPRGQRSPPPPLPSPEQRAARAANPKPVSGLGGLQADQARFLPNPRAKDDSVDGQLARLQLMLDKEVEEEKAGETSGLLGKSGSGGALTGSVARAVGERPPQQALRCKELIFMACMCLNMTAMTAVGGRAIQT
jgi:hypothetical protein